LIEQKDVVISMTYHGYVKRISVDEYKTQNRGGMGITAHKTKDEDFVQHMFVCNTHDDLLFFSNKGKVYCLKAFQVPEAARAGKGRAVVNLLPLTEDEKITAFLPIKSYETGYMIMATRNGLIKKCDLREFENIRSNGKIAITLTEDDELIVADITTGEDEILMASSDGKCIRFKEEDVRPTGRGSQGVRSIKLDEGDAVVDMAVIKEGCKVVTVTENGYGKRSDLDDYRLQGRGGKGIKAGTFTEKTGRLVNLKLVDEEHDLIIIADNGIMIRIAANSISNIGRNAQGVRLMRLKDGAKVVAMALTPHEEDAEYDEIDGEPADDTPAENAAAEADQPAGQPAQNDK
ncbi:MAG TPA: DNA gyrase C-terminal beta-propeller domain-containing protein, partial [Clostridia bacterium]|nr:DNA gyrase C-terminal beta-propeller domain-containing protein [Clostridia bacterium]